MDQELLSLSSLEEISSSGSSENDVFRLLTTFDIISSSSSANQKEKDASTRRALIMEAQVTRLTEELSRANEENRRLSILVETQSSTIKVMREDMTATALSIANTAKLSVELSKERDASEKLRDNTSMAQKKFEDCEQELKGLRDRFKVLNQDYQDFRLQTRRAVQQNFNSSSRFK